jgi:hypothetical protein
METISIPPTFITANHETFIVQFEFTGDNNYKMGWWKGAATQIQHYVDSYGENGWEYVCMDSSDTTTDIEKARIWFEFLFCWRGVWEGRVYFKDEEYWAEETKTIADLWSQIEAILKRKIKSDNPEYEFFDK